MKNRFLFIATLVFFLSSCKKEKTGKAETIYRLKSMTNVSSGVSTNFEYDTQKRIIRASKSNSQARSEYNYLSGSIKQDEYNASGTLNDTKLHELNNDGLAVKTTYSGTYYNTRSFNNNRQLLKEIEYTAAGEPMVTYYYYYTGERLDSMVSRTQANIVLQRNHYEYYTEINNTIAFQHYGLDIIYGRQYQQAPKQLKIYNYDFFTGAPRDTFTTNYTYEKDTEGRIIKSTYSGISNGSVIYSYY